MHTTLCQSIDEYLHVYGDMVFRIALQHVREDADAQDIVQEVFLKIMKKHPQFETDAHEKAWIMRVTMNLCNDHWRWVRRHPQYPFDEELVGEYHEIKDLRILSYVRTLRTNYRSVIYLFYYEEMSIKEIAQIMNRKEQTILTWLRRARIELRKGLGDEYDER